MMMEYAAEDKSYVYLYVLLLSSVRTGNALLPYVFVPLVEEYKMEVVNE